MKLLLILAMSLFLVNCSTSKKSGNTRSPDNVGFSCPDNYVRVPALEGYTKNDFCIMKYEAKNDGSNNAVSQASGAPYVSINRADSIDKCTSLGEGYDLITNDEWQSVARNIELVPENWAQGVVGNSEGLSRGHSDRSPFNALVASSDDSKGCAETRQSCKGCVRKNCSNATWDIQRRTHTLSNGEVLWDIAGNVWEWVKDHSESSYGSPTYLSQVTAISHPSSNSLSNGTTETSRSAKAQFGPGGDYVDLSNGGLGYGDFNSRLGGILRGGGWSNETVAGVFAVTLFATPLNVHADIGFRCVFHP